MNVTERATESIRPYEKNAKEHPKKQVRQIADSILEFGFNQPIVVDKDGVIIVGHGRYQAALLLELPAVPVLEVDIDEERAKAYRLADNKLNESDWDMKLVIEELKDLPLAMLDLTGFSRDLILDNEDNDDVVPGTPKKPRSKMGDIYQLGRHRLIVGDSTLPETYEKLTGGGAPVDMVFTDPPYNVAYEGTGKKTSRTIENDDMEDAAFEAFLTRFFTSAVAAVKAGAGWYVFHASSSQAEFETAMEEAGLKVRAQLIWNKPTASMSWADYRFKHEPFFYAGKKDTKLTFYGDRTHTTVVDFHDTIEKLTAWAKRMKRAEAEGLTTIWTMKRDSVAGYDHHTQKPVELITYALVNSSKEGDIVLDPFGGSGSTVIACQKTGRTCYSIELDPAFADVIVQRYCDYTGETEVEKNGEIETWESTFAGSVKGADAKE